MPESRQPRGAAGAPAMGLKQLLAEVRPHAIEPGAVGDYVALHVREGPVAAARAFPSVGAHLARGCSDCLDAARDVSALLRARSGQPPPGLTTTPTQPAVGRDQYLLAWLVGHGLDDRQIALTLGMTAAELNLGLQRALAQTGLDSRKRLAEWFSEEHLAGLVGNDVERQLTTSIAHEPAPSTSAPERAGTTRFARVVLDLIRTRGRPTDDGIVVDGPVTQTDIATLVGVSRETVNRVLRAFERSGIVRHERNRLTVLSPERLRESAGASAESDRSRRETVTLLATDIEGSIALWERDGNAMSLALARHDRIVRDLILQHGGHAIKSTGDGVLAVFDQPRSALDAAVAIQQAVQATPEGAGGLPVRIVVHTGDAELRDGDYYGQAVNQTARMLDLARGWQIIASEATIRLTSVDASVAYDVLSLGERSLRNTRRTMLIYQVVPRADGSQTSSSEAGAAAASPGAGVLSERELEVLRLLAEQRTNRNVANALGLSERMVDGHVSRILRKLDARGRSEALEKARSLGLLTATEHGPQETGSKPTPAELTPRPHT